MRQNRLRIAFILFELGITHARRRPILAFIGKSVSPPSNVLSLTYFPIVFSGGYSECPHHYQ
jgi:hypothetical protein